MIAPGKMSFLVLALAALCALLAAFVPPLFWGMVLLDVLVLAIIVVQAARLKRIGIEAMLHCPRRGEIGLPLSVILAINNPGRRGLQVKVEMPWPENFDCRQHLAHLRVSPHSQEACEFVGRPRKRGLLPFFPPLVTVSFPIPWVVLRFQAAVSDAVRIYPDMTAVRQYETLRHHRALGLSGVHRRRLLGSGREFEQLRDYLPDDEFRDINWRASAHHQRMISNLYQLERRQDVLICMDTSRLMAKPSGDRTTLDYTVSAAVLLAHVAGIERDNIGLLIFRDVVSGYVKPASGETAKNRIVEKLVEVHSEPVFPSFFTLASAIRSRQARRGMVFFFTDLNDPQLVENLRLAAPTIARRHLVTVFSLRDPLLRAVAASGAATVAGVAQVLAARHLSMERESSLVELSRAGVVVVESDADALNLDVINHYLSIRTRQLV